MLKKNFTKYLDSVEISTIFVSQKDKVMNNTVSEQVSKQTEALMGKLVKWGCTVNLSELEVADIERDIKRIAANALLEYQNTIYNATQDMYKQILK